MAEKGLVGEQEQVATVDPQVQANTTQPQQEPVIPQGMPGMPNSEVAELDNLVGNVVQQFEDKITLAKASSGTVGEIAVGGREDIQVFDDVKKIIVATKTPEVQVKTIDTEPGATINVVSKTKKERKKLLAMKLRKEMTDSVSTSQIVAPQSGYWAIMNGLTGAEIRQLKSPVGQDQYTQLRNKLETIYKKISMTSAGIKSFEDWMENTSFMELEIFEFGVFNATYANVNKYPFPCTNPECSLNNLPDGTRKPFEHKCDNEELLMQPDEETEELIINIVNDPESKAKYYDESIIKKRHEFVFQNGFIKLYTHIPSIADFLDVMSTGSASFRNKYPELAGYLPYINSMLLYDETDGSYIEYSMNDKDDVEAILETLRSLKEEALIVLEDEIIKSQEKYNLEFAITNISCPHCGTTYEKKDIDFNGMLFMMEDILKKKEA